MEFVIMDLLGVNPEVTRFLAQIVIGVVVAVITAWITVILSLRKFKDEALWVRKLDAYTQILEALHVQRLASEAALLAVSQDMEYEPVHKNDLDRKAMQAHHELQRTIDIGSLIIDSDAVAHLRNELKPRYEAWKNDPPETFYEAEEAIYRGLIKTMLDAAKRDLNR